jgi:hypothetical protein
MNGRDIAIISVFCTAIVGMLLRPVFMAWARRIDGRHAEDGASEDELAQLRERVIELETQGMRIGELEERLDFAERLLAQRNESPRLPANGTPQ